MLKLYLNIYNCLDIISICCVEHLAAILFENGVSIIFNHKVKSIVNTYYNVTKIIKTKNAIGILINDNKLITCNCLGQIFENSELNNLDYKYIYTNYYLFFIVGYFSIIIIKHTYYPNNIDNQLIIKYKISNITEIYYNHKSSLFAAIQENNNLIAFSISNTWGDYPFKEIKAIPLDNINNLFLKIKKVLTIDLSFVVITYDDLVFIWGLNTELVNIYNILKNDLIDVDDIVVSKQYIGILKKNNSIILISVSGSYCFCESYQYVKLISTYYNMFGFSNNHKINQIEITESNNSLILAHIEILNDIKELFSSHTSILAISNNNIIYVYDCYLNIIYFKLQILDLKSIRINDCSFIIIKNNNELIRIQYNGKQNYDILNHVVKFIKI